MLSRNLFQAAAELIPAEDEMLSVSTSTNVYNRKVESQLTRNRPVPFLKAFKYCLLDATR
jgi:hypothetical protein